MFDESESLDLDDGGGFQISEQTGIWICSIIGAICVGLSGIFPLLVIPIESGPALKHGAPAKKLRLMLSFAVGSLLGDVFLHLLPEVWAHLDRSQHGSFTQPSIWAICGLMGFMVIEKVLGETEEDDEEDQDDDQEIETDEDNEDSTSNNNKLYSQIKNPSSSITSSSSPSSSSSSSYSSSKASESSASLASSISSPVSSSSSSSLPSSLSSMSSASSMDTKEGPCNIRNGKKSVSFNLPAVDYNKQENGRHKSNDQQSSQEESSHQESKPNTKIKISGYLNLVANVLDNFTHGLAVGTSFCVSKKCGVVTTVAILLHEIPHEVGDFAILLQSGFDKWKAAKAQVWTASGGVVGAIAALLFGTHGMDGGLGSWMLPFTAGGFLYIALVTVVPDLMKETQGSESLKQVICILLGILSIIIVTFAFD